MNDLQQPVSIVVEETTCSELRVSPYKGFGPITGREVFSICHKYDYTVLIIIFITRLGNMEHRRSQLCYAVIRMKKIRWE